MRLSFLLGSVLSVLLGPAHLAQDASDERPIRLPQDPAVSPDGRTIAFAWQRDLWTAPIDGGTATRLTLHAANDSDPVFSPDGATIAFHSDRSGSRQIHSIPAAGGTPRQLTEGSARQSLLGFTGDGAGLVVLRTTDRAFHSTESRRAYVLDLVGDAPPRMLFDAGVADAALSPDGTKVLFTRGRASWSRKGYRGPAALQMWVADLTVTPPALKRLDEDAEDFQNVSSMDPMWLPDGETYLFVSDPDGTFDVYAGTLGGEEPQRLTRVGEADRSDDGVSQPSLSKDGRTLVFRRRFDLMRLDVGSGTTTPIELTASGDVGAVALERRTIRDTGSIAFTSDGKQMAFVAGEDVWVMDRILKEPVRVTNTPHDESSLVFSADDSRLFFVSDSGGELDIWEASHDDPDGIWWRAEDFTLRQVTDDRPAESGLQLSPSGEHVAFVKGTELFVMDDDGSDHRRLLDTWSQPSFDWSPDGRWIVYATQDDDYNSDVFLVPLDGTREPFNLSRHPDRDSSPVWSGDGKRIAFVSRREGEESDIYTVDLTREVAERTERDAKLEEALEAMKKGKGKKGAPKEPAGDPAGDPRDEQAGASAEKPAKAGADGGKEPADEDDDTVRIDFDGIFERMERISIPDSTESGLIWSPDGKTLAFNATIDGERGLYSVEFPDVEEPKKLASRGLASAHWLAESKEIVGLQMAGGGGFFGGPRGDTPAAMDAQGKVTTFGFQVRTTRDWSTVRQVAFDQGWRAMRDRFYDESMNNRDWEAIRRKYRPVASQTLGASEFSELMNMMLGELNASHMGHRGGADPLPRPDGDGAWSPTTYHLGLRFDHHAAGPGLVVESVIPGSPCHAERSRVEVGEVVLSIDDVPVGPDVDIEPLLTLDAVRDVELVVSDANGEQRTVTVRPTASVAGLLYDEFVEDTRARVEELSKGRLGYLHIRGMNMSSFRQMEEDLYHAGHGKDGLVIDVRFNGGGSTTDHVLTALTQPVHAITRSRGSGEGYPQDRKIYASWSKPIVLMCNEHSFSNAEILSHAVKQLGRGRLVGMRTAGGVISTGGVGLLDGSSVRMPMRGWYLVTTGEDMELNGCLPDIPLWNEPGGPDRQLEVAVETLLEDVRTEQAKDPVEIVPAATRRARADRAGTPAEGGR